MQPREPRMYGYARVSTRDQNLARQLDALAAFGLSGDCIFADKASGKDFERPEWRRLMRRMRSGDVLVVKSIDRLGRNYDEILAEWRYITKAKGADVVVLDMPLLDTRARPNNVTGTFIADLVLQLLSYVAQVERESIRARQAEGIASAKARGVHCGRPRIEQPERFGVIARLVDRGELSRAEAAADLGVSVSTFGRWLRDVEACRAAGLSSTYVAVTRSHGSSPTIDRYAALMAACGFGLAAVSGDGSVLVPIGEAPDPGLAARVDAAERERRERVYWELKQVLWDAFQEIEGKLGELADG